MKHTIKILILFIALTGISAIILIKNEHRNFCACEKNTDTEHVRLTDLVNFKMGAVSF
jgi:hypothetical protein